MFGLLANQLMQQAGHPVVVVNRPTGPGDTVSGSGRAPGWFDIIASLEPQAGLWAVGHQQACGVKVERAELLGRLVTVLSDATQIATLTVDQDAVSGDLVLGPDTDCDVGLNDLQPLFELVRRTESLKPSVTASPSRASRSPSNRSGCVSTGSAPRSSTCGW